MSASMTGASFAAAYDQYVGRVYAFAGYRVGNRADAEDLTQETFEQASRAWDRIDPARVSVATWLLTIARNLSLDRGGRRQSARDDVGLDPQLTASIGQLGEREREIMALRYGGGLPEPDIAVLTGLSSANVQQILSRSLLRLRAALDADAHQPVS
jgi:DNA-directed RNA polymerase specialized sigma24 family protein